MLGLILAAALVCEAPSRPGPSTLVDRLGSASYKDRSWAEAELARLGREALPALSAGKRSNDAEVRARSLALVARIENESLLQPTSIRLDFRDVPLDEALAEVNRRGGLNLSLTPEERPSLSSRRIHLDLAEPVSSWRAIDALCRAAGLHQGPEVPFASAGPGESLLLLEGPESDPGPTWDSGPFRVRLTSLHYQSEISLGAAREPLAEASVPTTKSNSWATREFFLQLVLSAEPRLAISRNGPIRVTTALDDRGRSLIAPAVSTWGQHSAGYFGMSPSSTLRFRLDLASPEKAGGRLKLLRGTIPVVAAMRRPEPLEIALAGPKGRSYRVGGVDMTLLEHVAAWGGKPALIRLAFSNPTMPGSPSAGDVESPLPDSAEQQVEILDEKGRILPWFPSATTQDGRELRLTLTLTPRGDVGPPATLRYHGILKASTEVAFEFRDLPMP